MQCSTLKHPTPFATEQHPCRKLLICSHREILGAKAIVNVKCLESLWKRWDSKPRSDGVCSRPSRTPDSHFQPLSLQSGQFPDQWKKGAITRLFKHKGSRSDPTCYRPMVLLLCASKVFEGLVKEQTAKSLPESERYPRRTIRLSAKEVYRVATSVCYTTNGTTC